MKIKILVSGIIGLLFDSYFFKPLSALELEYPSLFFKSDDLPSIMQNKVLNFIWLFSLFAVFFTLGFENKTISAEVQRPNLIFYLADDQNIQDYGCYGNDKVHTPAVDRLANEGILFENAFTAQAICAPSRSQIYTGNYPLKNGCFLNHSNTKPDMISVTKYLGDLGYDVILAGKSHVKPANVYNWDRVWDPVEVEGVPRPYIPLDSIKAYFANTKRPFCMFITSEYPHGEYFEVPAKSAENYKFFPYDKKKKNDPAYLKKVAGYYRSIEEDNSQLEAVLGWVDEYLDDNTLFIYSADHGVNGKFTVYDRGLNVPFVARWPGVIKPGTNSEVLVHYTDVLPTFVEIAGGEEVQKMDGKSFLNILKGDEKEIHEYVYGVQTNQNIMYASVFPSRMIRSKKYKYIRNFNSIEVTEQNLGENKYVNAFIRMGAMKFKNIPFEELYDLKADPFEQNNLAKKPEYLELKEKLAAEMFAWMKQQGDILNDTPGNMPLIKPRAFALDREEYFREVPDSLENTLTDEDYLILDYLMK